MKTIIILITMFFPDPTYQGNDAIAIDTYRGMPLRFATMQHCQEHVDKDVDGIKEFAIANWDHMDPKPLVKQILCVYEKDYNKQAGEQA